MGMRLTLEPGSVLSLAIFCLLDVLQVVGLVLNHCDVVHRSFLVSLEAAYILFLSNLNACRLVAEPAPVGHHAHAEPGYEQFDEADEVDFRHEIQWRLVEAGPELFTNRPEKTHEEV